MSKNSSLDFIRSLAILFVISVHALGKIGFYDETIEGGYFAASQILRVILASCVPLFLMLTGYLQNNKTELSPKYYKKLAYFILIYLISGVLCELYNNILHIERVSIKSIILDFLSFNAVPYGWYIEMYVGLFLIVPFINILWNNLDKRAKVVLISISTFITCSPSLISVFDFSNLRWWQAVSNNFSQIGVNYWEPIYPITYYFVGAFISDYSVEIKKRVPVVSIPATIVLFGVINYFKNLGIKFPWNYDTDYSGYQCMIVSFLIFVVALDSKRIAKWKLWSVLSKYSLGIYLTSYVADSVVYHFVFEFFHDYSSRFIVLPVTIIMVAIISLCMSIFVTNIVSVVYKRIL